jgi:hypothetical protein
MPLSIAPCSVIIIVGCTRAKTDSGVRCASARQRAAPALAYRCFQRHLIAAQSVDQSALLAFRRSMFISVAMRILRPIPLRLLRRHVLQLAAPSLMGSAAAAPGRIAASLPARPCPAQRDHPFAETKVFGKRSSDDPRSCAPDAAAKALNTKTDRRLERRNLRCRRRRRRHLPRRHARSKCRTRSRTVDMAANTAARWTGALHPAAD